MTREGDMAGWITVREAQETHYQNTPREKPVHRASVYRWVHDPANPVRGRFFGDELFVNRQSLLDFCMSGWPGEGS